MVVPSSDNSHVSFQSSKSHTRASFFSDNPPARGALVKKFHERGSARSCALCCRGDDGRDSTDQKGRDIIFLPICA